MGNATPQFQFQYTYERQPVDINMKVTIGATGAPTLVSGQNKGILSITRNSAGKYTIVLNSSFNRLLMLDSMVLLASGLPAAPVCNVVADNSAAAAKSIVIQYSAATNSSTTTLVATDPADGETLLISMKLKNAST